jgi:hypothetical protein
MWQHWISSVKYFFRTPGVTTYCSPKVTSQWLALAPSHAVDNLCGQKQEGYMACDKRTQNRY